MDALNANMQQMLLTTRPNTNFKIPHSDGYQLYSALLAIMHSADPTTSQHVHNSKISSIAVSGLSGQFYTSKHPGHKTIDPKKTYQLHIGITDPTETKIFQSLIQPLILNGTNIKLEAGYLQIEEAKSTTLTFEELMTQVHKHTNPSIKFTFMSPTCIQYKNSTVTEMFPHRTAVFTSLLAKWNKVCPPKLKMTIERDELARFITEKPNPKTYNTHSVMINTTHNTKHKHPRPIFKQGFTGRCTYHLLQDTPQDIKNAVTALSIFAEYSGVGSSVSRGCGWVNVEINEVKR